MSIKLPPLDGFPIAPVAQLNANVLISSVTGGGAETAARLLASPQAPWFRGDGWGSRPSGNEDEWTYIHSSFALPTRPSLITLTDGSDVAPWRYFHRVHPGIKIIRLVSLPGDVLDWRNKWRLVNALPPRDQLSSLTVTQLTTQCSTGLVVDWPDFNREPDDFVDVLQKMREYISN